MRVNGICMAGFFLPTLTAMKSFSFNFFPYFDYKDTKEPGNFKNEFSWQLFYPLFHGIVRWEVHMPGKKM